MMDALHDVAGYSMITRSNGIKVIHENSNANPLGALANVSNETEANPASTAEGLPKDSDVSFADVLECCAGDELLCCYDGTNRKIDPPIDHDTNIDQSNAGLVADSDRQPAYDGAREITTSGSSIAASFLIGNNVVDGAASELAEPTEVSQASENSASNNSPERPTLQSPDVTGRTLFDEKQPSPIEQKSTAPTFMAASESGTIASGEDVEAARSENTIAHAELAKQATPIRGGSTVANLTPSLESRDYASGNFGSGYSESREIRAVSDHVDPRTHATRTSETDSITRASSNSSPGPGLRVRQQASSEQLRAEGVDRPTGTDALFVDRANTVVPNRPELASVGAEPNQAPVSPESLETQQVFSLPDPDLPYRRRPTEASIDSQQQDATRSSVSAPNTASASNIASAPNIASANGIETAATQISASEIVTPAREPLVGDSVPAIPEISTGDINSTDAEIPGQQPPIRLASIASIDLETRRRVDSATLNHPEALSDAKPEDASVTKDETELASSNERNETSSIASPSSSVTDAYNSVSQYGTGGVAGLAASTEFPHEGVVIDPPLETSIFNATASESYASLQSASAELTNEALQRTSNSIAAGKVASADALNASVSPSSEVNPTLVSRQLTSAIVQLSEQPGADSVRRVAIELEPAELGSLLIQVEQTAESIVTQVIASELSSKELLHQHRDQLLETLGKLGFENASVDISHQQKNDHQDTSHFGKQDASHSGRRGNQSAASSVQPKSNATPSRLDIVA